MTSGQDASRRRAGTRRGGPWGRPEHPARFGKSSPRRDRREQRRCDRQQGPGRHRHELESRCRAALRLYGGRDHRPAYLCACRPWPRERDADDPRAHPARRARRPLRDCAAAQGRLAGGDGPDRLARPRSAWPDRRCFEDRARHLRAATAGAGARAARRRAAPSGEEPAGHRRRDRQPDRGRGPFGARVSRQTSWAGWRLSARPTRLHSKTEAASIWRR